MEQGFLCLKNMAALELIMKAWLAFKPQTPSCLCLQSAEIKDMYYDIQPWCSFCFVFLDLIFQLRQYVSKLESLI